jgi:YfiH family protein
MDLPVLDIQWPGLPASVSVLSTTRQGGVSEAPYDDGAGGGGLNLGTHVGDTEHAVTHNRALLRQQLPSEPVWLTQVHGTRVINADHPQTTIQADACIATRAGVVCAIMTADCTPVLLADSRGRVVGAAHAGWRGLASGVLETTVNAMRDCGAEEILAWLGPGIGPQAFEVGEDVLDAFAHLQADASVFRAIADRPGKFLADLPALAKRALAGVGVTQVSGGEHCTVTDPKRFYSFRRERTTGRMASMIWLS